jgi:LysM repeat protein
MQHARKIHPVLLAVISMTAAVAALWSSAGLSLSFLMLHPRRTNYQAARLNQSPGRAPRAALDAILVPHRTFTATVVALPQSYTVKAGDTLSGIAAAHLGNADKWPALWWANHSNIADPNQLKIGQVLNLPDPGSEAPWMVQSAQAAITRYAPPQPPTPVGPAAPASNENAGFVGSSDPVQVSTAGDGSFEQCVIGRESGGNPNVMNASGHYGLFQFSYSTWVGYGGDPGAFGHASVSEQDQVFANAMASPGGEDNWAPYDGC